MKDSVQGYYDALRILETSPYMGDEAGRKFIRLLRKEAPDGGCGAVFSLADTATRLGMSKRNLQRYMAAGLIRPSRRNGRVYFTDAEIAAFRKLNLPGPGRPKRGRMPTVIWRA